MRYVPRIVVLAILLAAMALPAFAEVEFIINNATEPQSLDPALIQGVPEHRIYDHLFEGLVINDPKTCKALPGVAEKWTISKDGLVYTFKLRKAVWSDGVAITAKTVADSWLRQLDPATGSSYASIVYGVKGAEDFNKKKAGREGVAVKAVDDSTFEVTLKEPAAYFLDMVTHYAFAIMPLHAIEKFGKEWTKPANFVGNGPFILKEWKPQDSITVVRNPKYWDAKTVKLDKVVFLPIDDVNTGYQKFKNGEIDWDTTVPLALIEEVKKRKDYQVSPQVGSYYYIFNVNMKPIDDVRVRKALAMSINQKEIVEKVTKGGQLPATSVVPPMPGYTPTKGNGFNPKAAQDLLAKAGYPGGKGFPKLTVIYNTNEGHKKIGEYIQQSWKTTLGIEVELQNQEWKTFLDNRNKHVFEISRAGWIGDYMDPNTFLAELLLGGSGNNSGDYKNPKYDELVKKAAKLPDGKARFDLLRQAEDLAITQDQALAPIYIYVSQNLIDTSKWGGWYPNPLNIQHPKFIFKKK